MKDIEERISKLERDNKFLKERITNYEILFREFLEAFNDNAFFNDKVAQKMFIRTNFSIKIAMKTYQKLFKDKESIEFFNKEYQNFLLEQEKVNKRRNKMGNSCEQCGSKKVNNKYINGKYLCTDCYLEMKDNNMQYDRDNPLIVGNKETNYFGK